MTLEDRLRALAKKGELVHLSLAFSGGTFHCNFAAASPQGGYSSGVNDDPVLAMEAAFTASPVKTRRPSGRPRQEPEAPNEITATVNEPPSPLEQWSKP